MEPLRYLTGFDNEHETEALPGALPIGQFSPQKVAYGLYAEQFTSTAFTAPRAQNRRTWFYRIRPSAQQGDYLSYAGAKLTRTSPITEQTPVPNMLRWSPLPLPTHAQDFIDGLVTLAANGDAMLQYGPSAGLAGLRTWLAEWQGVKPEQVLTGNGSLELVEFLCTAMIRPGDVVFTESPSYDRAITLFRRHGAKA